jgi:hypothetical protein
VTTFAPFGFRPARLFNASSPNYAINGRSLAYNYASQIGMFDPVFLNTSGNIALYVNGGSTIDGIANGFEYFDPNNILSGSFHAAWNAPVLPAATVVACKVITDPNMVFIAQAQGPALTASAIGKNIDVLAGSTGAPTPGSGISVAGLDATNVVVTNTLPFRIVGILGLTPGWGSQGVATVNQYNPTTVNQFLAVTMNTQDMTTRTGQA